MTLENNLLNRNSNSSSNSSIKTDYRQTTCICCLEEHEPEYNCKCNNCGIITCKDCSKDKWTYICPHCNRNRNNSDSESESEDEMTEIDLNNIDIIPIITNHRESICYRTIGYISLTILIVFIIMFIITYDFINIINNSTRI